MKPWNSRKALRRALFSAPFALLTVAPAHLAHAGPKVAGDAEVAIPVNNRSSAGLGGGLRVGYQINAQILTLTPELGLSYISFPSESTRGSTGVVRGLVGARLGLGALVRPGIAVHVGYGGPGSDPGLTTQVGGFLDFTALPILDVGLHGTYVSTNAAVNWVALGAHLSIGF